MLTEIKSSLLSVTILITEKDLDSVRSMLNVLKEKHPKFSVFRFRTGNIGEDIIVSFKVYEQFYKNVIEILTLNDISIIMKDKITNEYVVKKKKSKRKKIISQG